MKTTQFYPEITNIEDYDAVEINPVYDDGELTVDVCEPKDATYWSVYLHQKTGGVVCIADVPDQKTAERLGLLIEQLLKFKKIKMKTKFVLDIHKKGEYNTEILQMIANHNGGTARIDIDIDVICGFLLAKQAMHPHEKLSIQTEGANGQTIKISDDGGETFYLTITEQEISEEVTDATCEIVKEDPDRIKHRYTLCNALQVKAGYK